jgi:hypothetical protein
MVRNAGFALLAASAVIFAHSGASAGSLNSYNSAQTPVVSYTGVPEPTTPGLFYDPAPAPMRDGMYDTSKGSNDDFGYSQSHACGGALIAHHFDQRDQMGRVEGVSQNEARRIAPSTL